MDYERAWNNQRQVSVRLQELLGLLEKAASGVVAAEWDPFDNPEKISTSLVDLANALDTVSKGRPVVAVISPEAEDRLSPEAQAKRWRSRNIGAEPQVPAIDAMERRIEMLLAENTRLREAGAQLAMAALHVATENDGVDRLMLAVSAWATRQWRTSTAGDDGKYDAASYLKATEG